MYQKAEILVYFYFINIAIMFLNIFAYFHTKNKFNWKFITTWYCQI